MFRHQAVSATKRLMELQREWRWWYVTGRSR